MVQALLPETELYPLTSATSAPRLLRVQGAADYLGLATSTLAKMRLRGDGPPYAKVGRRIVVYELADLDAWLAGRKRRSTSEPDGAPQTIGPEGG